MHCNAEGLAITSLIQVCADPHDGRTREREIRALLKASAELRCDNLLLLTESEEREQEVTWFGRRGVVKSVPLWKWLLAAGAPTSPRGGAA